MDNQRKLRRRHLIYYLRVVDRSTDQFIGHLVDVTTEGVMIMSDHAFEEDSIHQFSMALPEVIEGSTPLHFDVKCVWSREGITPGQYDSGFELLTILPEHRREIERLIVEFGFRD